MGKRKSKKRLDEILLDEELISPEQIQEALLRQKAQGGKFGSQLLYCRHINEETLLNALEIQFGCPGVVISKCDVPEILIQMIPLKVALSRKVLPFDYNPETNILKVACDDPNDQKMIDEITFISRGKNVEFYVAVELSLVTAISKYYQNKDVNLDDNLLLEIPDILTESGHISIAGENNQAAPDEEEIPRVLLITDEVYTTQHIQSLLERDKYEVIIAETCEEALSIIQNKTFDTILVKDTICDSTPGFNDRIRKISPCTRIAKYQKISSLLLKDPNTILQQDLLVKNFDLILSLLSSQAGLSSNHSVNVGRYADRLCRKMNLPENIRILIINAAYLHDFAKYYYRLENNSDNRMAIGLTVRLLGSVSYQPEILNMLSGMYAGIQNQNPEILPIDFLGANILTIVDLFCEMLQDEELTFEKSEIMKRKIRDMSGRMVLPEVAEAFIGLMQDDLIDSQVDGRKTQVMIFAEDPMLRTPLNLRLENEGFRTILPETSDEIIKLYKRCAPDMMMFAFSGNVESINEFLDNLSSNGIKFNDTPTYLMVNASLLAQLTNVLENGIEDIIANEDNLDFLMTKLRKIKIKLETHNKNGQKNNRSGAQGRLLDMSLIDLIQALGPGQKTAKLTIHPNVSEDKNLTIYLNQGAIIFAKFEELTGPQAVYEGLTWIDGTWEIEPITVNDMPEPNIQISNESILMEGCQLMDEKLKAGQLK